MNDRVAGVILAGGRSSRMDGANKALLPLSGRPLLAHVAARLEAQVERVLLSVERQEAVWEPFGLRQVADPLTGHHGPLGGLLAALGGLEPGESWLLLVPCDAPFLPRDLGQRLLQRAQEACSPGAFVAVDGQPQPTFSLWHAGLLPQLEQFAMAEPGAGLKAFAREAGLAELEWTAAGGQGPSPFFNINDAEALARARAWLAAAEKWRTGCSA